MADDINESPKGSDTVKAIMDFHALEKTKHMVLARHWGMKKAASPANPSDSQKRKNDRYASLSKHHSDKSQYHLVQQKRAQSAYHQARNMNGTVQSKLAKAIGDEMRNPIKEGLTHEEFLKLNKMAAEMELEPIQERAICESQEVFESLQAIHRSMRDMITKEVSDHGATISNIEHGGKHLKVHLAKGSNKGFVVLPKTPSDHRSALNSRGDVRRMLRSWK